MWYIPNLSLAINFFSAFHRRLKAILDAAKMSSLYLGNNQNCYMRRSQRTIHWVSTPCAPTFTLWWLVLRHPPHFSQWAMRLKMLIPSTCRMSSFTTIIAISHSAAPEQQTKAQHSTDTAPLSYARRSHTRIHSCISTSVSISSQKTIPKWLIMV